MKMGAAATQGTVKFSLDAVEKWSNNHDAELISIREDEIKLLLDIANANQ
jgi:hypothetical protein